MPAPIQIIIQRDLPYLDGLRLQQAIVARLRADSSAPETLLCVEHQPVITLGRKGEIAHLQAAPETLTARGVEFHRVTRGGDITYHGPGQWTIYPLLRLHNFCRDLHRYLRMLEEMVIVYLQTHQIVGERNAINSGVWIGVNKICAVGIACSNWISWHGAALNIQPDLTAFQELIVPCGIDSSRGGVTSLTRETGQIYAMIPELEKIIAAFAQVFPYTPIGMDCLRPA